MKQAVLDTSFILTCVKQKIDFIEDIRHSGIEILIPKQVIEELMIVSKSKKKKHFKDDAKFSLKLLSGNSGSSYRKIDLGGKNVDKGLVKFSDKNKNVIVATLDRELKKKIKNSKLIIRGKKMLEVV